MTRDELTLKYSFTHRMTDQDLRDFAMFVMAMLMDLVLHSTKDNSDSAKISILMTDLKNTLADKR